jgi:hypothetical protein
MASAIAMAIAWVHLNSTWVAGAVKNAPLGACRYQLTIPLAVLNMLSLSSTAGREFGNGLSPSARMPLPTGSVPYGASARSGNSQRVESAVTVWDNPAWLIN